MTATQCTVLNIITDGRKMVRTFRTVVRVFLTLILLPFVPPYSAALFCCLSTLALPPFDTDPSARPGSLIIRQRMLMIFFIIYASTCFGCDDFNIATDANGTNCTSYQVANCGNADDADFQSSDMCCVCGGGIKGTYAQFVTLQGSQTTPALNDWIPSLPINGHPSWVTKSGDVAYLYWAAKLTTLEQNGITRTNLWLIDSDRSPNNNVLRFTESNTLLPPTSSTWMVWNATLSGFEVDTGATSIVLSTKTEITVTGIDRHGETGTYVQDADVNGKPSWRKQYIGQYWTIVDNPKGNYKYLYWGYVSHPTIPPRWMIDANTVDGGHKARMNGNSLIPFSAKSNSQSKDNDELRGNWKVKHVGSWYWDYDMKFAHEYCGPCGDGVRNCAEECDDNNTASGDGCDSSCRIELGYVCDPDSSSQHFTCQDKSTANIDSSVVTYTDSAGNGCSTYTANPALCGTLDNVGFSSASMCCACSFTTWKVMPGGVFSWLNESRRLDVCTYKTCDWLTVSGSLRNDLNGLFMPAAAVDGRMAWTKSNGSAINLYYTLAKARWIFDSDWDGTDDFGLARKTSYGHFPKSGLWRTQPGDKESGWLDDDGVQFSEMCCTKSKPCVGSCSATIAVPNGATSCTDGSLDGSNCTYACNEGFYLSSGSSMRSCHSGVSLTFTGTAPVCSVCSRDKWLNDQRTACTEYVDSAVSLLPEQTAQNSSLPVPDQIVMESGGMLDMHSGPGSKSFGWSSEYLAKTTTVTVGGKLVNSLLFVDSRRVVGLLEFALAKELVKVANGSARVIIRRQVSSNAFAEFETTAKVERICPTGLRQDFADPSICIACQTGTYTSVPGLKECWLVEPGHGVVFDSHGLRVSQSLCPPGTYSYGKFDACSVCPAGSMIVSNSEGVNSEGCKDCGGTKTESFQIGPHVGISACAPCPVGLICNKFAVVGLHANYWMNVSLSAAVADGQNECVGKSLDMADASTCLRTFRCFMDGCNETYLSSPSAAGGLLVDSHDFLSCSRGYEGTMCSMCETDFYRSAKFCIQCPDRALVIVVMVIVVILVIWLVYVLFNSSPRQSFLLTKYKVILGFLSVTASLVRNIPQVDLGQQLKDLIGALDFLNLNITGLFFSAFSCIIPKSDSIETKLFSGILLPVVVCFGVVLWKFRTINLLMKTAQKRKEDMILTRAATDTTLLQPTQDVESATGHAMRRQSTMKGDEEEENIFAKVLEMIKTKEFETEEFSQVDREVAERLFKSYDYDGGGEISISEMMTMCQHMDGVKITPTQIIEVMKAFDDDDTEVSLNLNSFVAFLSAYKQAVIISLDEAGKEEEADNFSLFPTGSAIWLHDQIMRAEGKMWKNCLLTQYMLLPPVVSTCCNIFVCDPKTPYGSDDPFFETPLLRLDYSVQCYTERHLFLRLFAIIGVLVYAVAIPAFWAISLYSNRHHLEAFRVFQKLGFLYVAYKPHAVNSWAYLWDVFETLRKLILGSVVVFVSPGSTTQLFFFLLICMIALVAHVYILPFKTSLDNKLQGTALAVIVLTSSFALYLITKKSSGVEPEIPYLNEVILIINGGVIAITVCLFSMSGRKVCILIPKMIKAAREAAKAAKATKDPGGKDNMLLRNRTLRRDSRNSTPKLLGADDANAAEFDSNATTAGAGVAVAAVKLASSAKSPSKLTPLSSRDLTREQLAQRFEEADEGNSGRPDLIETAIVFELIFGKKSSIDIDKYVKKIDLGDNLTLDIDQFWQMYTQIKIKQGCVS